MSSRFKYMTRDGHSTSVEFWESQPEWDEDSRMWDSDEETPAMTVHFVLLEHFVEEGECREISEMPRIKSCGSHPQ
jgi:hypothetical protein